jgi:hypothetical protein
MSPITAVLLANANTAANAPKERNFVLDNSWHLAVAGATKGGCYYSFFNSSNVHLHYCSTNISTESDCSKKYGSEEKFTSGTGSTSIDPANNPCVTAGFEVTECKYNSSGNYVSCSAESSN